MGQSAKQWLKEKGILEQSYYKWQRKFRKETFELMQATDLNVTPAQKNSISCHGRALHRRRLNLQKNSTII